MTATAIIFTLLSPTIRNHIKCKLKNIFFLFNRFIYHCVGFVSRVMWYHGNLRDRKIYFWTLFGIQHTQKISSKCPPKKVGRNGIVKTGNFFFFNQKLRCVGLCLFLLSSGADFSFKIGLGTWTLILRQTLTSTSSSFDVSPENRSEKRGCVSENGCETWKIKTF
jgi:hypothetical protein